MNRKEQIKKTKDSKQNTWLGGLLAFVGFPVMAGSLYLLSASIYEWPFFFVGAIYFACGLFVIVSENRR